MAPGGKKFLPLQKKGFVICPDLTDHLTSQRRLGSLYTRANTACLNNPSSMSLLSIYRSVRIDFIKVLLDLANPKVTTATSVTVG